MDSSTEFSAEALQSLRYKELQQLAKSKGIKANQSTEVLMQELSALQPGAPEASIEASPVSDLQFEAPEAPPAVASPAKSCSLAAAMSTLSLDTPAKPVAGGIPSREALSCMKYNDLRSLAKQVGTPAKGKAVDLVEAILAAQQRMTADDAQVDYETEEKESSPEQLESDDMVEVVEDEAAEQEQETPRGVRDPATPYDATPSPCSSSGASPYPMMSLDTPAAPAAAAAATAVTPGTDTEHEGEDSEADLSACADSESEAGTPAKAAAPPAAAAAATVAVAVPAAVPVINQLAAATSAADAAALDSLVAQTSYLSWTAERKRVLCAPTGHELPPRLIDMLTYLASKKTKKAVALYLDAAAGSAAKENVRTAVVPAAKGAQKLKGLPTPLVSSALYTHKLLM
jgi:hypothetical protein